MPTGEPRPGAMVKCLHAHAAECQGPLASLHSDIRSAQSAIPGVFIFSCPYIEARLSFHACYLGFRVTRNLLGS